MSLGEGIGLALTAGLIGGLVGAVLMAAITLRRNREGQRSQDTIAAYAEWLAARLALSRACGSFVAAFRSLAIEPRDGPNLALRTQEAQRARSQWCDAMRDLDLAEAALLAGGLRLPSDGKEHFSDRMNPDALRRAINGDFYEVNTLHQELRRSDRQAIEHIQRVAADLDPRGRSSVCRRILSRAEKRFESIISGWSAPP
jgi:hypothetical protein